MGFVFSPGTPLPRAVNPHEALPWGRCRRDGGQRAEGEAASSSSENPNFQKHLAEEFTQNEEFAKPREPRARKAFLITLSRG